MLGNEEYRKKMYYRIIGDIDENQGEGLDAIIKEIFTDGARSALEVVTELNAKGIYVKGE